MSLKAHFQRRRANAAVGGLTPAILELDSSISSNIIFNGSNVQQKGDDSGNGNHFQQAVPASSQPLFQTGVQNGLSSILYDGVDDRLEGVSDFQTASAYTIFIVSSFVGTGPKMLFNNSGTVGRQVSIARRNDGANPLLTVFLRDSSLNTISAAAICPATAHCLLTLQYESGRAIVGVNGAGYAQTSNPSFVGESMAGDNLPYVGTGRFGGGGAYFQPYSGYIDHVIFIPAFISTAERTIRDNLLISKWGL
jgi:hypothetical protein